MNEGGGNEGGVKRKRRRRGIGGEERGREGNIYIIYNI